MTRNRLRIIAVLFSIGASSVSLEAQVVKGRLLDSASKRPIVLAAVMLLDSTMTVLDRTITDQEGAFALEAPRPGDYYIGAERPGYKRKIDGVLQLGAGGSISVDFYLVPQPLALDTLSVAARQRHAIDQLEVVGFHERRKEGSAWFLGPADLEKMVMTDVARLFRGAPGARIVETGTGTTLLFRGGPATTQRDGVDPTGSCTPRVLIDGTEMPTHFRSATAATAGATLDGAVSVEDIIGIEVHNGPASLPLLYAGTSTSCTTVLIWTTNAGATRGRGL